ncbi:MAG: hypothetical protein VCF25_05740 [Candidatus Poribacteria bacterium]
MTRQIIFSVLDANSEQLDRSTALSEDGLGNRMQQFHYIGKDGRRSAQSLAQYQIPGLRTFQTENNWV